MARRSGTPGGQSGQGSVAQLDVEMNKGRPAQAFQDLRDSIRMEEET
ncbi:hypothetical protein ACF1B0_32535 [Streptomyces anandii]